MVPDRMMFRGKAGLFSSIESTANLRNIRAFVALTSLLLAVSVLLKFTVPEIGDIPLFMASSAALLLISVAGLIFIRRKKGAGNHTKWFIGIGFIVTAVVATSTMGAAGSILFVFPMLLSIPYCSFLYSLFISAITIMSTFVPMLLSSRLSNYDLNVVRFIPDTVIKITSTLEASLEPGIINAAGTKLNELLSTFLPILLFLNIIAVVTVSITAAIRKNLLEQYHQFQNTRE